MALNVNITSCGQAFVMLCYAEGLFQQYL